jgi:hypothetical protein
MRDSIEFNPQGASPASLKVRNCSAADATLCNRMQHFSRYVLHAPWRSAAFHGVPPCSSAHHHMRFEKTNPNPIEKYLTDGLAEGCARTGSPDFMLRSKPDEQSQSQSGRTIVRLCR